MSTLKELSKLEKSVDGNLMASSRDVRSRPENADHRSQLEHSVGHREGGDLSCSESSSH